MVDDSVKSSDAYSPNSFVEMLGLEDVSSGQGRARVKMPIQKRHLQSAGNVQGGLIVALADAALSRALLSLLPEGQRTVTVELKLNFIARASEGNLFADGKIIHKGGTLAVGEMTVTNDQDTLIATGVGTWMILKNI